MFCHLREKIFVEDCTLANFLVKKFIRNERKNLPEILRLCQLISFLFYFKSPDFIYNFYCISIK